MPRVASSQAGTPIKLIVPFTPGTGIDLIARQVGPHLSPSGWAARWSSTTSPAPPATSAPQEVVRAAADGSTLLVTVNTLVMNRALYPRLAFDPLHDLEPVTLTSWGQLLLVAQPKSGIDSAQDLIAARQGHARARSTTARPATARRTTWRWSW